MITFCIVGSEYMYVSMSSTNLRLRLTWGWTQVLT